MQMLQGAMSSAGGLSGLSGLSGLGGLSGLSGLSGAGALGNISPEMLGNIDPEDRLFLLCRHDFLRHSDFHIAHRLARLGLIPNRLQTWVAYRIHHISFGCARHKHSFF